MKRVIAVALAASSGIAGAQVPARGSGTMPCNDGPVFEFQATRPAVWIADTTLSVHPITATPKPANLIQFVVDAAGVPDTGTFHALKAADRELVAEARRSLARWRYTPALLGDCKVPQLIQTPVGRGLIQTPVGRRSAPPAAFSVGKGARVRLLISGDPQFVVAELIAVKPDSIVYQKYCTRCAQKTVPRAAIVSVEVSAGGPRDVVVLAGVLVGAIVAGGVWILSVIEESKGCRDGPCGIGVILTPEAAAVGGLLGGIIGWFIDADRWEPAVIVPT